MKSPEELLREKMMKRKSEPEKEVEIDDGFNDLIEQEKKKLLEEMSLKETFEKSEKIKQEELRALAREQAMQQIEEEKNQAQNLIFLNEQKKLKQEFFNKFRKYYYHKLWIKIIQDFNKFSVEMQEIEFKARDYGIVLNTMEEIRNFLRLFVKFIEFEEDKRLKEQKLNINVIELGESYLNTYESVRNNMRININLP